jgi:hypothetical protein
VKPAPVTEAELTVNAEEPDEVIVSDNVAEELVATLPKLSEEGLADNCGFVAAVAVPLKETVDVLPVDELLLMVSWPVTVPAAVGLS